VQGHRHHRRALLQPCREALGQGVAEGVAEVLEPVVLEADDDLPQRRLVEPSG
jgi:hypothetical protein